MRLECYDHLTILLNDTSSKGKWSSQTTVSPLDDSKNVYLILKADAAITNRLGETFLPVLIIRCEEKGIDAYIVTGMAPNVDYSADDVTVKLSFDKNEGKRIKLSKSTDGKALFFQSPKDWVRQIEDADALLFEFTPYNSAPVMTTFDIRGLKEAIEPLRKACSWPRKKGP